MNYVYLAGDSKDMLEVIAAIACIWFGLWLLKQIIKIIVMIAKKQ